MKKAISIAAALLIAAGCCSCSKNDNKEKDAKKTETVTTVSPEETAEKKTESSSKNEKTTAEGKKEEKTTAAKGSDPSEYRYYTESDFKKINVKLTYSDKEFPYELECIDLSKLDFGEKLPLCNTGEYADSLYNSIYNFTDENHKDMPEKGSVGFARRRGDDMYLFVDYSAEIMPFYYEWSIFRYGITSKKLEEIYSWSTDDISKVCGEMLVDDNTFFYKWENGNNKYVNAIELDTLQERTVFENETDKMIHLYRDYDNSICVNLSTMTTDTLTDHYTYDSEKDRFVEDNAGVSYSIKENLDSGSLSLGESANSSLLFNTDNYTFTSNEVWGNVAYADDKYIIIDRGYQLDTYDLTKMEHYSSSTNELGNVIGVSDNKVFLGLSGVYCLIPDLGIVYKISENGISGEGYIIEYDKDFHADKLYLI